MKILKESLDDIVVLTLQGEFDNFEIARFAHEVEQAIHGGSGKLVLNMREVPFISSTALGSLLRARKQCLQAEGTLVLSEPSAAVSMTLESTGLDRRFTTQNTDQDAIAMLDKSAALELTGDAQRAVLIHLPHQTRTIVGRLCKLLSESIECRVPSETTDMIDGRELRLKFRLPLYRKEPFQLSARIESRSETPEGLLLGLRYTEISDEDEQAIERFLADMEDLRRVTREGD